MHAANYVAGFDIGVDGCIAGVAAIGFTGSIVVVHVGDVIAYCVVRVDVVVCHVGGADVYVIAVAVAVVVYSVVDIVDYIDYVVCGVDVVAG